MANLGKKVLFFDVLTRNAARQKYRTVTSLLNAECGQLHTPPLTTVGKC